MTVTTYCDFLFQQKKLDKWFAYQFTAGGGTEVLLAAFCLRLRKRSTTGSIVSGVDKEKYHW